MIKSRVFQYHLKDGAVEEFQRHLSFLQNPLKIIHEHLFKKKREEGCDDGLKMYYAFVNIHIFKMNNWGRKEYISSKKTWKSEDGNRKIERQVRSKDLL